MDKPVHEVRLSGHSAAQNARGPVCQPQGGRRRNPLCLQDSGAAGGTVL